MSEPIFFDTDINLRKYEQDRIIICKPLKEKKIDYRLIAFSLEWEGNISIGKLNKRGTFSYSTNIKIANTEKELLEVFQNIIKIGYIANGNKAKEMVSKQYIWRLSRKEISEHLDKILPYMSSKERQMELVIEINKIIKTIDFMNTYGRDKRGRILSFSELYTEDEVYTMESCYQECLKLNDRYLKIKRNNKDIHE